MAAPLSMNRLRLAIHAHDPLSQAGIISHLGRNPDLEMISPDRLADADIIVVTAPLMNGQALTHLRTLAAAASEARFVLILDRLGDSDLLSAVELGVVAVLWRSEATADRFGHMLMTVSRGGCDLPTELQAKLVADVASLQREVLAPRGLTAGGLDSREVDVLRFIAEGLDTSEIAEKMLYSERTVKGILYGLMARLNLRNRSHAVAYAMRAGIL